MKILNMNLSKYSKTKTTPYYTLFIIIYYMTKLLKSSLLILIPQEPSLLERSE